MIIFQNLGEQLFGVKYERAVNSLIACIILFLAIHTAGIEIEIAPSILLLTATAFSMGIMWQTLNSSGNADRMAGLFMLPFRNREMTFSLVLAFTSYTLITKTFLCWLCSLPYMNGVCCKLLCLCSVPVIAVFRLLHGIP